jgi:hypothetical protein
MIATRSSPPRREFGAFHWRRRLHAPRGAVPLGPSTPAPLQAFRRAWGVQFHLRRMGRVLRAMLTGGRSWRKQGSIPRSCRSGAGAATRGGAACSPAGQRSRWAPPRSRAWRRRDRGPLIAADLADRIVYAAAAERPAWPAGAICRAAPTCPARPFPGPAPALPAPARGGFRGRPACAPRAVEIDVELSLGKAGLRGGLDPRTPRGLPTSATGGVQHVPWASSTGQQGVVTDSTRRCWRSSAPPGRW